jgi:hypothetical protein
MRNKTRWYSILLVGLVFILTTLLLSCGPDHVDNAQDYLKRALRATGDLRNQVESQKDYHETLQTIDYVERLIEDALQELHDMRPNY